jgi:hypothetical protein
MANIVQFPSDRVSSAASRISGGCHVLIFPGVRIERHEPDFAKLSTAAEEARAKGADRTGT